MLLIMLKAVLPTKSEIRSGSQLSGQGDELSSGHIELYLGVEHFGMCSKQMTAVVDSPQNWASI